MKNIILLFIAAALLYSCSSSLDHPRHVWKPELKLTSSIKNENNHYNLVMTFQNLTRDTLRFSNPICAPINIIIWNAAGDTLDEAIKYEEASCEEPILNMNPYTTETYVYKQPLDNLFNLSLGENYNIKYVYYGNLFTKKDKARFIKFRSGSDTTQFVYSKE